MRGSPCSEGSGADIGIEPKRSEKKASKFSIGLVLNRLTRSSKNDVEEVVGIGNAYARYNGAPVNVFGLAEVLSEIKTACGASI